ncbi:MAG: iron ABC transporter permease [Gammaproteobacteria bacterium]|nr:iron ABC transporter permease [Gammaproteobacteria bacterium]
MPAEAGRRDHALAPRTASKLVTLVLLVLVLGPLLVLIHLSLLPAGSLPLSAAPLGLQNYVRAFHGSETLLLVRNTLWYAGGSVIVAVSVATALAWLCERTDLPFRALVHTLMFSWMAVPPLVMAFGWILLLNPNNGALNLALQSLLGLEHSPLSIYSIWAMIAITGLSLVPTTFVMVGNLLRNMDPQLENAATVSGASRLTVIRRITVPLLSPGLLSIAIYLFMVMVQAFDVPLAIGLTARVPVLSTRIFVLSSAEDGLPSYGLAAALGVVLMLIAMALMTGYFRAVRTGERFRVVTGKAFRPRRLSLGRLRGPLTALVAGYFALMFLPLLMLLWTSLLPFYQTPSLSALATIDLHNYDAVLATPLVQQALLNTVILVLCSATLVMLLAGLVSWFCVRGRGRWTRWLEMLAFAPVAVPNIVIAMAIGMLYLRTPLYGSVAILVLAHVSIYIAFGTRTLTAALLQIHEELENAAIVSGASWLTTLRRIVLPLLWPQFLNGWLWVVAHSARDLTVPLMLMSTGNIVVSSLLWLMWEHPDIPGAAALAILNVVVLMGLVLTVRALGLRGESIR